MNYMRRAIELAKRGTGWTAPNPLVGAVIVKNDRIIGEGWHVNYGELHAERHALKNCTESPEGADMYVTLEPCCHQGKQPPCTEAIVEANIRRVFIGSNDPNPLVAGRGIANLKEHGIDVICGVEKEACDVINRVFFHYIQKKIPYVVMKYAMTLDGKIATRTGESKWITGEKARQQVQADRHKYTAIMVGIGTVIADNPMLNCRIENGKNPIRIICDTRLRIPMDCNIVKTAKEIPTIIAYGRNVDVDIQVIQKLNDAGCELISVDTQNGHIDLRNLWDKLGKRKIDSVLLEGGGTLNESALRAGLVNYVQAYIAPKIFGGEMAKTPVAGMGVEVPDQSVRIKNAQITRLGEDILIEGEVNSCVYRNC